MKRIMSMRPSPALIVAIVALIAALGGTAIAVNRGAVKKVVKQYATRTAHAEKASALIGPPSGTTETALSTPIKAPRAGFLQVVASTDSFGTGLARCEIAVDGTKAQFTQRTIDLSQDDDANCATNGTVPVSKGTHTVAFLGVDRPATAIFDLATLDVLWVPLKG